MNLRQQQVVIFGLGLLLAALLGMGLFFLKPDLPKAEEAPPYISPTPSPSLTPMPATTQSTSPGPANDSLLEADAAYAAGKFSLAIQLYQKYLIANPEVATVWLKLGNARRESGDSQGAIEAYRQAQTNDPLLGDSYLNRAAIHWQLGERETARAVLEEGISRGASRSADLQNTLAVYEARP